jgi:glycosyltransferase involved in cell wall biosynthesis
MSRCKRHGADGALPGGAGSPQGHGKLQAFARYLAQAHGCGSIEVRDERSPQAAMRGLRPHGHDPVTMLVVRTPAAAAERTLQHMQRTLADSAPHTTFFGIERDAHSATAQDVALLHPRDMPQVEPAPERFRVLAIVPTYNEEDVIALTLRYLIAQGVEVYLLDNWSTDHTLEQASVFLGHGLSAIERYPAQGPTPTYELGSILRRVEEISASSVWADWVVLHDADERRRSPWRGVGLRDALWRVERCGYSCIDHVTLNFWPVDERFDPATADLEEHFHYFEFSDHPGHFHQRRAWKRCAAGVSLAANAGHDASFAGRRVYPYKFLLKHYPVRSRAHGERKVLQERAERWNAKERALGWHRQYDGVIAETFVRDPRTLRHFDPERFEIEYLVERLSGVGVFQAPPSWATAPVW